ncbi:MAG: hypothetical protein ACI9TV_000048 [Sulfurimonas sp.]|jgi:hypothetical protein|uniref:DUF3187 domain-containing protein n=1 Tax=Sulfurimonas sp. TaxID=2022749 RepID=UPI0039E4DF30
MLKTLTYLLILTLNVTTLCTYDDFDIDGVEDKDDKCPKTLISDLVDISGCTIKSLEYPHHFDIILGASYAQTNYNTDELSDTFYTTLVLEYYYENFSVEFSSSYFNSDSLTYNDSGLNDSYLTFNYTVQTFKDLSINIGAGIILPTYQSDFHNTTDYISHLNFTYNLQKINIFASYSYTIINDADVKDYNIEYKNTKAYNAGFGFYTNIKLYNSLSYSNTQSIYTNIAPLETLYLHTFYSIDQNWFTTSSFGYGLSDSAGKYNLSLELGYYF